MGGERKKKQLTTLVLIHSENNTWDLRLYAKPTKTQSFRDWAQQTQTSARYIRRDSVVVGLETSLKHFLKVAV